uniref:Small ribosomal subunit protein eS1 n=1 Tax=Lotharella oceanica TaxID=641309 RepID=A0A7S2TGP6_9EUKA|mmetsp:Transcript_12913/g.24669  ORF Transcript_12913/g.24669 Transcript_12913/m.24669 type:complete len:264 (+) Transcript_12913:27-818(+)|eukprot:CAMPEP_0170178088 /NCGR_PEP_ID=MMETSP0040_2-20121228/11658_1 /TAXON_ID=641309 /ORGANISM="Lotharella oceanica, Strain CCMP622" /LENGTH=263 /DNA_ID=CAMNT_0010421049 /DNA_START=27 /DNA_END=818 /DNA_ORIENTATION=-
MAIGKNKRLPRKKGKGRKKIVDPFSKKEWFEIKAPNVGDNAFAERDVGYTVGTKTIGTRLVRDNVMNRVFEASVGDLKPNSEDEAYRKFKLKVGEVDGKNLLTYFWGMDLTTDKLRSLVRKWTTLIEAQADVKTTDGTTVRLFCIGFTYPRSNQQRKTSYAQKAQVRAIRKKMVEIMVREASTVDTAGLVKKLIPETIGNEITKATQYIYPLKDVLIRKVKTIKAQKIDIGKLLESHKSAPKKDMGKKVARMDEEGEKNLVDA